MRRVFFQFSDDPGDVSGGAHVVEREFDGAVGTDEEGGADHAFDDFAVVLFLPKGTPFFEHVFVGVGEQGKGEVVFLAEGHEFIHRIGGDAHHLYPQVIELCEAVAEVAGFCGASGGVGTRVEVDEHAFTLVIGQ